MKDGFIKTACATPAVRVADCGWNRARIEEMMRQAYDAGARIIAFPELCLTGYTCDDLFLHQVLTDSAARELALLTEASDGIKALIFVGFPLVCGDKIYDTAAVISDGSVLGFVPKTYIPSYGEYYEQRHFARGPQECEWVIFDGEEVPFGSDQIFTCDELPQLRVACEIGEDLAVPCPPSIDHALTGANVIVNLSACAAVAGKGTYRRSMVENLSGRLVCAYLSCSAGEGESSQDLVFSGQNLIAENGVILSDSGDACSGIVFADVDLDRLCADRKKQTTYETLLPSESEYTFVPFSLEKEETKLDRIFPQLPFVPADGEEMKIRCGEILTIQARALKKRMDHIGCKCLIVGLSGGLDSTLAILVMAKACDLSGLPRSSMVAVTMPGFGTTDRTYDNACKLAGSLGCELREIPIAEAVTVHFRDIGHDINVHDAAYENAQARERTQILMDLANQMNGLVVGTGDMSELALGWATYNGDHMSMYGVNASVPKTLVRHLVRYYAEDTEDTILREVLMDVLDTPVSPELLPPKDGEIVQKTEDLVGPYELHDFFMYYMLRFGYPPAKILRIARLSFEGSYDEETIVKWLKTFCRRFFSQQFKRSCVPDGPKVGSVGLSPRGDLRMPSDACAAAWLAQLEGL